MRTGLVVTSRKQKHGRLFFRWNISLRDKNSVQLPRPSKRSVTICEQILAFHMVSASRSSIRQMHSPTGGWRYLRESTHLPVRWGQRSPLPCVKIPLPTSVHSTLVPFMVRKTCRDDMHHAPPAPSPMVYCDGNERCLVRSGDEWPTKKEAPVMMSELREKRESPASLYIGQRNNVVAWGGWHGSAQQLVVRFESMFLGHGWNRDVGLTFTNRYEAWYYLKNSACRAVNKSCRTVDRHRAMDIVASN